MEKDVLGVIHEIKSINKRLDNLEKIKILSGTKEVTNKNRLLKTIARVSEDKKR